ncbi:hypothetical protein GUJ93_ZPchr0001g30482 [Zizania palustris]|uniref:Uncharacterized protein n=1 Tax=Zizania palustris TaxID=103762 RepID=A0A8J5V5B1_ZIZPA|nr:hypothetical protein GUJ93_ZPchr0001g30482 [Zizania palustris]
MGGALALRGTRRSGAMSGLGDRGTSSSAVAVLPPAAARPAAGLQCAKRGQDEAGVAEVFGEMPPQLTEILFSQMRCPSNPEFSIRTSSWIQRSSSKVIRHM